jgi:hypothetical protein
MNGCALKRLNSEFKKFPEHISNSISCGSNINIEICDIAVSSEDKKIGILINNKIVLTMIISNNYPFSPPSSVFVYEDNMKVGGAWNASCWTATKQKYDKWSVQIFENAKKNCIRAGKDFDCSLGWAFSIIRYPVLGARWNIIPRNSSNECLCCNSIICNSNWGPALRICDLFNEYLGRRIFSLYCSKLQQRIIKSILNNDKWNIPEDIVFHIVDILIAESKMNN